MTKLFKNPYILAILSGILLSPPWYEWGTGFILFIAFIPLLRAESIISEKGRNARKIFLIASLAFFIWNILTTWWIKNASFPGLLAAVFFSTFVMSIPFTFYHLIKTRYGKNAGFFVFIFGWLAYEYAYMHGELSWPWLTLGHGFAYETRLIQWYEITGVHGGSLWILLGNIIFYSCYKTTLQKNRFNKESRQLLYFGLLLILLPVLASLVRYHSYKEKVNPREIVVVQPNIDPYMKFNDIPSIEQTMIQVREAARLTNGNTGYIVAPETSISNGIWVDQMDAVPDIKLIRQYIRPYKKLKYVVGIMCLERYNSANDSKTSRPLGTSGYYYDTHNSAIQIDSSGHIPIYHKSMLVTGVEKMPYTWLFKPLEKLIINLGGIFRYHGIQEEREVFTTPNDGIKIAPVICYESVFGEFVGDYIKLGANYIFVITNDGWWGNTPGHRQHNSLSALRAIETRRSIARSANTGISCFINQRGDILNKLEWWKRGAIKNTLNANDHLTFYVKHGDYIGRFSFYISLLIILFYTTDRLSKKFLNRPFVKNIEVRNEEVSG